jgi:hypothetical protein
MYWRQKLPALVLLLVVLLTSACETPLAKKAPTATPASTPPPLTIKPAHPVVWTAHQWPTGLTLRTDILRPEWPDSDYWIGLALSKSDGDTVYFCVVAHGQAQVRATNDRAEHWILAGSVPVTSRVTDCYIAVDATQPRQALLQTYTPDGKLGEYTGEMRAYLTTDGGATWAPRDVQSGVTPILTQLASLSGVSYALANTWPRSHCNECFSAALYISKDGMLTWSRIDADLFLKPGYPRRSVDRFWLAPSGELLAEVFESSNGEMVELWRSMDQGTHWNQITLPATTGRIFVASGQSQRFWRVCEAYIIIGGGNSHPPYQQITRTLDGGATWRDTGGPNSAGIRVLAQAADGALLAATMDPYSGDETTLLRVAPRQSAWESLGAIPAGLGDIRVSEAGSGSVVLWRIKQPANLGALPTAIYTATYP